MVKELAQRSKLNAFGVSNGNSFTLLRNAVVLERCPTRNDHTMDEQRHEVAGGILTLK